MKAPLLPRLFSSSGTQMILVSVSPLLGVMDRSLHVTFTFSSLPGFPLGTVIKGTLVISTGQSRQSAIRFWKLQMKNQPVSTTLQTQAGMA